MLKDLIHHGILLQDFWRTNPFGSACNWSFFPYFNSCIQRGTTKLILLGNMPLKISKKFGFLQISHGKWKILLRCCERYLLLPSNVSTNHSKSHRKLQNPVNLTIVYQNPLISSIFPAFLYKFWSPRNYIFFFITISRFTPRKIRIFSSISNSKYQIPRVYYVETTISPPFYTSRYHQVRFD